MTVLRPEDPEQSSRPAPNGRGTIIRQRNGTVDGAGVERHTEQPSATDAVERVIEAGQRLVTERIELARLEAEDAISRAIGRAVFVVLMGLFAFSGWWAGMAAVIILLDQWMPLPASLAVVGGAHVLLGSGAIAYATLWSGPTRAIEGTARA
jgi:uncharacterized membrane protein YqjE